MKVTQMPFLLLGFVALMFAPKAMAQMWGAGVYGGMQACPYQMDVPDDVASIQDEIDARKEELKDAKDELRKLKSRQSSLKTQISSKKDLFRMAGFDGEAFSLIENHITSAYSCSSYVDFCKGRRGADGSSVLRQFTEATVRAPAADIPNPEPVVPPEGQDDYKGDDYGKTYDDQKNQRGSYQTVQPRRGAQTSTCVEGTTETTPFGSLAWARYCGPGNGDLRGLICSEQTGRSASFNRENCQRYLADWIAKQKELNENTTRIAELDAQIKELQALLKADKSDLKEAMRDYERELREGSTEADCAICNVLGNGGGGGYRRQSTDWGSVIGNVVLGLGSMYLGNQNQKYISNQNAKLGFPTQSYPSFMNGYPYFMGAMYGALGGGTGSGAYGCGGGMNGTGGMTGPYGMMSPFGMNSMYGPQGGAFGYPPWMYGNQMSGGMFLPGMGPWGMNMPGGSSMCMQWPCPIGGMMPGSMTGTMISGGFMTNGMMPGYSMMPGTMMPGYMNNFMVNGGFMNNGMMPGYMNSGMMPGTMMPGYMNSMMVNGGFMNNGMMPGYMNGGMMPGTMMPGYMTSMMVNGGLMSNSMMPGIMTGTMDGGMMNMQYQMQMQQSMMQMQMQQYQSYVQQQQQRYQAQMAGYQTIMGLSSEMQSLQMRYYQVLMNINSGGYLMNGSTGLGGADLNGLGGGLLVPNAGSGYNNGGGPLTPGPGSDSGTYR